MIKVAMIGFGGIAQNHRYAYWCLNREGLPVQLVAACDTDAEKFKKVTKINIPLRGEITDELPFNQYSDYKEMLEKEKPDLVDICLPTKFHESIAIEALNMGYSVLCEKPMAEDFESCKRMLDAANKSGKKLMVGHCVRFQPEYEYLQMAVNEKIYGNVISADFCRYTGLPLWGNSNWRSVASKAGSCLFDLNIHDVDIVEGIFGKPQKVSSKIQNIRYPYDRSECLFYYPDFKVKVNGAWFEKERPFSASYSIQFEKGNLKYDNGKVTFTDNFGSVDNISVMDYDMFTEEIRYFVNVLGINENNIKNPPVDSATTIYTIEKLFESSENGGAVIDLE